MGIPLAAVALVVALRPEIATGTFSSASSALKVAALIALWLGFSWVVRRYVENAVARTAIIAVAGAGVLALTVWPYFRDKTVDDPFPAAVSTEMTAPTTAAVAPAVDVPAPPPAQPTGPVKLGSGQLEGLAGHRGSGEAALYRQPDGSLLVRFEGFNVSSVPAPVVYLVPGAGRESPGGVKLGALRGNRGDLNIPVPAGTNVSGPQTILIWCEAFSVPVAGATAA
jgi:hypothetical protein